MKKLLLPFLLLSLIVFSCDDDDSDTTKPQIANLEPEENEMFEIGVPIHFEADISDNEGLRSYKIDIHNNFDNHGHGQKLAANDNDSTAYSFTKVWMYDKEGGFLLEGMKNAHLHHHEIIIPTQQNGKHIKPGRYHFVLYVVDMAGNETMQARNIVLTYDEVSNSH